MGGLQSLIGVAPDRKQLTAVQAVDNKGHTGPQARKVCVCVCVIVCKYVDHCLYVVPFMEGAEGKAWLNFVIII